METIVELSLKESEVRYRRLFEAAQDGILILDAISGAITDVNPFLINMLGYSLEEFIGKKLWEVGAFKDIEASQDAFEALQKNEYIRYDDLPLKSKSGKIFQVEFVSNVYKVNNEDVVQCNIRDITERKRAETALYNIERKYFNLVNQSPDGIFIIELSGNFLAVNKAMCLGLGYSEKDLLNMNIWDFIPKKYLVQHKKRIKNILKGKELNDAAEYEMRGKDGTTHYVEITSAPYYQGKEIIGFQGIARNVTDRKRAQVDLQESEKRYRALVENNGDAISMLDANGNSMYESPASSRILGYKPGEWIGKNVFVMIHLDDLQRIRDLFQNLVAVPGLRVTSTFRVQHKSGSWLWVDAVATNLLDESGVHAIVLNYRDITESKQSEVRIQRQLDHLTSLSSIDRVITTNFDLKTSLSEILTHLTRELNVDAADILLYNPVSHMLEFGVERGFRSISVKNTSISLGKSYAGRAALERRIIHIPDIKANPDTKLLEDIIKDDDFVCYFGVPLIAKGQIKGVLEIFNRTMLEPDAEWLDFLNTLAAQVAIAIESFTLFENLNSSNLDLTLAYDATIEGWSRALDLRDKETEGHTQRVTDVTVKLSRAFGLSDLEIIQIRWGALLHDIGKMGVPDKILLKPGPLTDEEWIIMKKHPTLAYEMLYPIRHLRSALDIPYSHHEKWDGSGYPQGLAGVHIPKAARIFAVVDVWDALNSDRPYRAAWPADKVSEYIINSSGSHFDPHVVDVFTQILK
jgi:PAS domain S-box-containing protein/putative nucleotidyltransferase with HDIG domain